MCLAFLISCLHFLLLLSQVFEYYFQSKFPLRKAAVLYSKSLIVALMPKKETLFFWWSSKSVFHISSLLELCCLRGVEIQQIWYETLRHIFFEGAAQWLLDGMLHRSWLGPYHRSLISILMGKQFTGTIRESGQWVIHQSQ